MNLFQWEKGYEYAVFIRRARWDSTRFPLPDRASV